MSKKSLAVAALLALLAVPATSVVAIGTPAGASSPVTVQSNLCYQSSHRVCADGTSHEMDAYLPSGATQKTPGVILVHGGSFVGGDKANFTTVANVLAQDGIAAFSINYRLDSPTVVGYPMEEQDVMAAVTYVRAHAGRYNVDPTRLALFGSSAGATLAVQAGVQAFQNDPSAQVRALVGWSGGYDFPAGYAADAGNGVDPKQILNVEQYLGCTDLTMPSCLQTAQSASAVTWIKAGDPATLLANSTEYAAGCEIVDPAQAREMAADLRAVGVPVTLDLNAKCAHALGYTNYELPSTVAFLESHLFVAPAITSSSSHTFHIGRFESFLIRSKANPSAGLTESGALPGGLTFAAGTGGTAMLSGTAQAGTAGTYPVVITAANGGAPDAVQRVTLTVR